MAGKVRRTRATEAERILKRHGFEQVGTSGSHAKWRHPVSRMQAIVPTHAGRPLPAGTLAAIMTGANIRREEWTD